MKLELHSDRSVTKTSEIGLPTEQIGTARDKGLLVSAIAAVWTTGHRLAIPFNTRCITSFSNSA
jgi:hypothetical protein